MALKKVALIISLSPLLFIDVFAQKLPAIQRESVHLPAKFKIDGKATEWDNKFQAFNPVTNLYYTVANNSETLYLVIHAKSRKEISRICYNGFTFSLNTKKKSDGPDLTSLQFPFAREKSYSINLNEPDSPMDTTAALMRMDANNQSLYKQHKFLKVNGIKEIDTLSVYNNTGIKVAQSIDIKQQYTLEIAIPIKYLGFLNGNASKIYYGLQINALPEEVFPKPSPTDSFEVRQVYATTNAQLAMDNAASSFWGEYTLAK